MKKIVTLMAAAAFGASGLMAAQFNPASLQGMKAELTPEAMQKVRAKFADMHVNGVEGENSYTRSWTDNQGGVWDLMLSTEGGELADALIFTDKDGNQFQYTFYEYPFYNAQLSLNYTPKGQSQSSRSANFILAWPCQYVYSQIFEHGSFDIPEDQIDRTIVTPEELMNNTQLTRVFEQTGYTNNWDDNAGTWGSWTILPSDKLNIQSSWDGLAMYSQDGSTLDFQAYESAESFIQMQTRVTLRQNANEGTRAASLRITYTGTGRVEGFKHVEEDLPNFGDIYLFNTGLTSSDLHGVDSGFTEKYPELTQFYLYCGDAALAVTVEESGPFAQSKVGHMGVDVPEGELEAHAQILYGYLFGEPKYAKDIMLDPKEAIFNVRVPWDEYDESTEEWYLAEAPVENSFVPMGYSRTWSRDYGTLFICHNNPEIAGTGASFGWGTTTGFHLEYASIYDKVMRAVAPETSVIYYYDPSDLSKKRTFSVIGTLEWTNVEEIIAAIEGNVVARDGKITVTAAEKAPIAIYTLDGKLVKAAEATDLTVEAAKGVYVVRVGNKAQKVVL